MKQYVRDLSFAAKQEMLEKNDEYLQQMLTIANSNYINRSIADALIDVKAPMEYWAEFTKGLDVNDHIWIVCKLIEKRIDYTKYAQDHGIQNFRQLSNWHQSMIAQSFIQSRREFGDLVDKKVVPHIAIVRARIVSNFDYQRHIDESDMALIHECLSSLIWHDKPYKDEWIRDLSEADKNFIVSILIRKGKPYEMHLPQKFSTGLYLNHRLDIITQLIQTGQDYKKKLQTWQNFFRIGHLAEIAQILIESGEDWDNFRYEDFDSDNWADIISSLILSGQDYEIFLHERDFDNEEKARFLGALIKSRRNIRNGKWTYPLVEIHVGAESGIYRPLIQQNFKLKNELKVKQPGKILDQIKLHEWHALKGRSHLERLWIEIPLKKQILKNKMKDILQIEQFLERM